MPHPCFGKLRKKSSETDGLAREEKRNITAEQWNYSREGSVFALYKL